MQRVPGLSLIKSADAFVSMRCLLRGRVVHHHHQYSRHQGKLPVPKFWNKMDAYWQRLPIFCQFSSHLEHFQFRGTFGKKLAIIANLLSMRIYFWQLSNFVFVIFGLEKGCVQVKKVKAIRNSWFKLCYLCNSVNSYIFKPIWTLRDCCFNFSWTKWLGTEWQVHPVKVSF